VFTCPWIGGFKPDQLPLMVSWPAPGPWIVRFLARFSSPLVSVIVAAFPLRTRLGEKTMVSLLWAAAISARREPAPLS